MAEAGQVFLPDPMKMCLVPTCNKKIPTFALSAALDNTCLKDDICIILSVCKLICSGSHYFIF